MEMLLVLAVLMTVVLIVIPSYQNYTIRKEEKRFFELFQQDIYFAQSQTHATTQTAKVVFREKKESYEIFTDIQTIVLSRKIPKSIQLKKTSNLTEIYFNSNGTVVQSGTLRFATSSGEKAVTVHLGGGRVVFSE
ncbi:competence protein ComG [Planococcus versutus]|uniref:Competence protein ComG n=1 Tax=Planococcus versutus TaxID=1302659 RepID=A0A1B1S597_9BACL|nr:competence protein ComG [Planococcus versutus]